MRLISAAGRFCNVARIRNFHAFNFCRLSNWRKIFKGENFLIYDIKFVLLALKYTIHVSVKGVSA